MDCSREGDLLRSAPFHGLDHRKGSYGSLLEVNNQTLLAQVSVQDTGLSQLFSPAFVHVMRRLRNPCSQSKGLAIASIGTWGGNHLNLRSLHHRHQLSDSLSKLIFGSLLLCCILTRPFSISPLE